MTDVGEFFEEMEKRRRWTEQFLRRQRFSNLKRIFGFPYFLPLERYPEERLKIAPVLFVPRDVYEKVFSDSSGVCIYPDDPDDPKFPYTGLVVVKVGSEDSLVLHELYHALQDVYRKTILRELEINEYDRELLDEVGAYVMTDEVVNYLMNILAHLRKEDKYRRYLAWALLVAYKLLNLGFSKEVIFHIALNSRSLKEFESWVYVEKDDLVF